MIIDLHSHFPMHLAAGDPGQTLRAMTEQARAQSDDRTRAWILELASRAFNYPSWSAGPAVTIPALRQGGVRIALSVLYSPFDEMDVHKPYGARPDSAYFPAIVAQMDMVEAHLAATWAGQAVVARSRAELAAHLADPAKPAILIHAIEGGFHVGADAVEIAANVPILAQRGVIYITVAHLFWRQVATNCPSLPFLSDDVYDFLFTQPQAGLTDRGRALVDAMMKAHIFIDVTHMSERSLLETLARREAYLEAHPGEKVPIIATHAACRFGNLAYNLSDDSIRAIARTGGIIGLILCDHYATDGIRGRTRSLDDSIEVLSQQIEHIHALTGSYGHIAIGSDLDGFIKPTLNGLDDARLLGVLEARLVARFSTQIAQQICSENAMRVIHEAWR